MHSSKHLIGSLAVWHNQESWWLKFSLFSNPCSYIFFFPFTHLIYSPLCLFLGLPFFHSPPCLFSSFVPTACVSQMERLAAMAVMQNTFQMNAGLPQWKRHQRQADKYSFYSFWEGNLVLQTVKKGRGRSFLATRREHRNCQSKGNNDEHIQADISSKIWIRLLSLMFIDCFPHVFACNMLCNKTLYL